MKKKKVLFISSTGGHFNELQQLKPLFEKYDYRIITEKDKANEHLKEKYKERLYFLSSIDASNDSEAKLFVMTALGISPLYIGVVSISSSYSPL